MNAIKKGRLPQIQEMLTQGKSMEAVEGNNRTVLMQAVYHNQLENHSSLNRYKLLRYNHSGQLRANV